MATQIPCIKAICITHVPSNGGWQRSLTLTVTVTVPLTLTPTLTLPLTITLTLTLTVPLTLTLKALRKDGQVDSGPSVR